MLPVLQIRDDRGDEPRVLIVEEAFLDAPSVKGEQVVLIPQCAERGKVWLRADREHLGPDRRRVAGVRLLCPDCSQRKLKAP
jgi:hypothetical protein